MEDLPTRFVRILVQAPGAIVMFQFCRCAMLSVTLTELEDSTDSALCLSADDLRLGAESPKEPRFESWRYL